MVENLQAKLYQLENKQVKGAKLRANIRSWRAKKCPKTLFKELERENMQYQTILELYTDDNKSKYSRNPKDILKSEKKKKKKRKLYIMRTSTAATTKFVRKIPNRKEFLTCIFVQNKNLCCDKKNTL